VVVFVADNAALCIARRLQAVLMSGWAAHNLASHTNTASAASWGVTPDMGLPVRIEALMLAGGK